MTLAQRRTDHLIDAPVIALPTAVRLLKRENRTRDNNILAAMAEADDVMHTSPTQEDSPEKITPPDASPEAMMGTAATDSGRTSWR